MKVTITQEVEFSDERIEDLLCAAFEGGSNYWLGTVKIMNVDNVPYDHCYQLPLKSKLGGLRIKDAFGDEPAKFLDNGALVKGLKIMAEKYPEHFENFRSENEDAETGDVFLQCCSYGDIIYG